MSDAGEGIPFDSGHAFPGILPDLSAESMRALGAFRGEALQYGTRPGLPELRAWISAYMKEDGATVAADEIIVVNGAKHGIDLVCSALLEPGDAIVVTAPTYYTAIPIFRSHRVQFIEIGQDDEGMSVAELETALAQRRREGKALPKFIYDVPDFHNPSAISMSLARRTALLALAGRENILLLEDSPYRTLRFEGQTQPSLKSLDREHHVIGLGTFSKLLAPGLRIGWVSATRELVARIAGLKSDGGSSPLLQRTIVEFCTSGKMPAHAVLARSTYHAHRDRMVAALRRELPQVSFRIPQGGYYLWLTLEPGINGDELAKRAGHMGVNVIPASKFFAGPARYVSPGTPHPINHVRLAFSHASPIEIDEGVRRLASAYLSMHGSR